MLNISIEGKRRAPKEPKPKKRKKKRQGFTNRLAIYILWFLAFSILLSFILAWRSITYGYVGALACWTVSLAPIGTIASAVIGKVVDKSKAENTGPNGEGIKYATAESKGFVEDDSDCVSPPI